MANTLTFANQTLDDANIFGGIKYLVDMNAAEEFCIGNTASACVSFVTDVQVPLYSKDNTNGFFTWEQDEVSRGRFYVTEVTKEADLYTVEAYDAMSLLDVAITNLSTTYPASAAGLASAIATYMGCTISGTIYNGALTVSELDEFLSIRTVLGYIAEASGCSVKIDGSDQLCFMYYEDSGITITASEYVSLNVADYTCAAIDNVTIFNSEGEVQATAGSGTNSLYIGQNPFLEEATATNAQTILSKVSNFEYAPLTCELFDDTDIEVGTVVTFGDTPTLVMHIDSSEDGATASSFGSDVRANYNKSALEVVGEARAIAVDAQTAANMASGLLAGMQTAAAEAGTTLTQIYADAADAKTSAEDASISAGEASASAWAANVSANAALNQLGIVADIVGVLDLIAKNGDYQLTTDTEIQENKWYFNRVSGSGTGADPYVYELVASPDVEDIGTYYELVGIDTAIQNYVSSHLVLTSSGLSLQTEASAYRLDITTTGMNIIGADGVPVASYGTNAIIGSEAGFHIIIDANNEEIGFYQGNNKVAYMNSTELYVVNSLSFGHFVFVERANGHFTLKLID